jgi:phosphoribosylanthranilate isomerase
MSRASGTQSKPVGLWIKICGWNDSSVLETVLQQFPRPAAIGLNFFARSLRSVTPEVARAMIDRLPSDITPVGLFVDHSAQEIDSIARQLSLTTLQIHGDQTPTELLPLKDYSLIRVYRVQDESRDAIAADLAECAALGLKIFACLVEPKVAGEFGGTGQAAPWEPLRDWPAEFPPLILAGGLTPANVAEAIRIVRPWGVDVASGVERTRGAKDPALVADFIAAARSVTPF